MHKQLLFIVMFSFLLLMNAMQTDEQLAMQALFEGKRAINRAPHAGALHIDMHKQTEGIMSIDRLSSYAAVLSYLQANLKLDTTNRPLPSSFWQTGAEIAVFEIVNEDRVFPYTYTNPVYEYSVTFNRPGIVLIVRLVYPR